MIKLPDVFDPLLDKAGAAFDLQDQHDAMAEFHRVVNEDYWTAPLLKLVQCSVPLTK
ncbi:MAG: hypothetical protein CM1200mP15_09540 [Dehalococcoidia bacterium]|nr:MAG: hypothetical protein CM1200mP15_09540 [Dehalococcoidia bacterium]